jgi:hypothetical protein
MDPGTGARSAPQAQSTGFAGTRFPHHPGQSPRDRSSAARSSIPPAFRLTSCWVAHSLCLDSPRPQASVLRPGGSPRWPRPAKQHRIDERTFAAVCFARSRSVDGRIRQLVAHDRGCHDRARRIFPSAFNRAFRKPDSLLLLPAFACSGEFRNRDARFTCSRWLNYGFPAVV